MELRELFWEGERKEIDLKRLLQKLLSKWYFYAVFVPICLALAYFYIKASPNIYAVNTTLLIDVEANNQRNLGQSDYIKGGVNLISSRKNLQNEIGILSSFNLVRQAIERLDFGISYYVEDGLKVREQYHYFPFEVSMVDSSFQASGVPLYIEILDDTRFKLHFEAENFTLYQPKGELTRKVERAVSIEEEYRFGQECKHSYFHFTLKKPPYEVSPEEFEDAALFFEINSLDNLANTFRNKIEIESVSDEASIILIHTEGPVLQKEIDFLNSLNETYVQNRLREKDQIAAATIAFIEGQLGNITDSLQGAESQLERFRRDERAVDLSLTATTAMTQLQTLEKEQADLAVRVTYYRNLLRSLEDSTDIDKISAPFAMGISDPLLNELILDLKRLHTQKIRMASYASEQYNELLILQKQIEASRHSLKENVRSIINSSQIELTTVQERIAGVNATIQRLPKNEKELVQIQRKYTLNDNLFNYLQERLAEVGIAKAENTSDTKVLDAPRRVGDSPVSPKKNLIMAFALMVGLIFPTLLIIGLDIFNDSVQDAEYIEKHSQLPLIASIGHKPGKSDYLIASESIGGIAESFRDLSTNLDILLQPDRPEIIGITSTVSGEGKTFCAANLAMVLADAGRKVLLMDADLRKPSFSHYLTRSFGQGKGLSDYLKGEVEYLSEIIYETPIENLHLVPTEAVTSNPHKWLHGNRLDKLMVELNEEYDHIVLDTPPVGLVSDYLLLSRMVDASLFVVRHSYSKQGYLADLKKLVDKSKLKNVFLIYNDVSSARLKYGYYKYGYRYQENGKGRKKHYII